MPRWEPDARGRLLRVAIDLFVEQGYEQTTVTQIAERAGLTKTTFFRHFPDKREVLFFGQGALVELAATAVAGAPADAEPLDVIAAAIAALAGAHRDEQREYGPQLQAVVAANLELRERSAFKHASIADALAQALRARGVADSTAWLAAEMGAQAYYVAFDRWVDPANDDPLPELAHEVLEELRSASAELTRSTGEQKLP
jgi:AcrR family transcriptional regulator